MRLSQKSVNKFSALLFLMTVTPAVSGIEIGQLLEDSDTGFVIRNEVQKDIKAHDQVEKGDALGVFEDDDIMYIKFYPEFNTTPDQRNFDSETHAEVEITYGTVK